MTANEAREMYDKYKSASITKSVRADIEKLIKMVLWQSNEIGLLMCCGTCKHWNRTENQCNEPELIERYGHGNYSERMDTCSKWKMEGGA